MADDGLDGGSASHLTFDLRRDAALLLGRVDFELVFGRGVVAAVTGIGMEALDGVAEERLDRRNDAGEGVSVVGIAGQRLHVGDELAALATLQGGGDADLDAELVGLVRLALADAFDLGRVQAVDLGAPLAALLIAHPPRQAQQGGERGLERGLAVDLAGNVPDDAAEIGLELAQGLSGAVELAGMGVALVLDEGLLADPHIGLAQLDAELLGQRHQLLASPVHELGIGREGDVLRLHRGVDDGAGEIAPPSIANSSAITTGTQTTI